MNKRKPTDYIPLRKIRLYYRTTHWKYILDSHVMSASPPDGRNDSMGWTCSWAVFWGLVLSRPGERDVFLPSSWTPAGAQRLELLWLPNLQNQWQSGDMLEMEVKAESVPEVGSYQLEKRCLVSMHKFGFCVKFFLKLRLGPYTSLYIFPTK